MAALENYGFQPPAARDDPGQGFDLASILGIVKRRYLYFAIPFLLVTFAGYFVIKALPKVYRAQGEILLESPTIPADLVHPTITELADQRFAVIRERIASESNLTAVMDKYHLFEKARATIPAYLVLDLMRSRLKLAPTPLELTQPNNASSAFTVSFDYEVPSLALAVTNEFIGQILSQDSSRRTTDAGEITKFLEQQVRSLQDEHNAIVAQIEALKQHPDQRQAVSEEITTQMKALAELQAELVQKSMVYSDEYPVIKNLKRKIAALKRTIASAPQAQPAASASGKPDVTTQILEQQELNLQKNLDEANQKLAAARLGETMERNQQAQHLQLIESPELPHQPVSPKKMKLFGIVVALAGLIGGGLAFAAEFLDGRIHGSRDLAHMLDPALLVTIPYFPTSSETYRRKRNRILLGVVVLALVAAGAAAIILSGGVSIDLAKYWASISTLIVH